MHCANKDIDVQVCVCLCVCACACACVHACGHLWLGSEIRLPVGGQTECRARQQIGVRGTLGPADTPPPLGRWWETEDTTGGPADTWVTLRESAPHLASLFHFTTLSSRGFLKRPYLQWCTMSCWCFFVFFTLTASVFVHSHARRGTCLCLVVHPYNCKCQRNWAEKLNLFKQAKESGWRFATCANIHTLNNLHLMCTDNNCSQPKGQWSEHLISSIVPGGLCLSEWFCSRLFWLLMLSNNYVLIHPAII